MNGVRGHDPLPLEHLEREETFTQLRGELQLLSTADREILTLRYAMDYNANDIADMLGIDATGRTCVSSRKATAGGAAAAQGVVHLP